MWRHENIRTKDFQWTHSTSEGSDQRDNDRTQHHCNSPPGRDFACILAIDVDLQCCLQCTDGKDNNCIKWLKVTWCEVSNASSLQKWKHSTLTASIVLVISMNKRIHTLRGKCLIDNYSLRYLAFPIVNSRLNLQNASGVCPYCDCQLLKILRIEWNRKDLTLQKSFT